MKLGSVYVGVRAKTDQYQRDLANAKTLTEKAAVQIQHKVDSISFNQVGVAALAFGAVMTKIGLDGFRAVEKMKLSTASLAATITSFAKNSATDLAGTYKQAYAYSGQLVLKMEEWNAKTVATGANLTAMVETLAQNGVLLDLNNKKQEHGFLAIANALALMTQGQNQDIQFRQEIRGLVQGEVRATNLLARLLSERIGGELKKHVELWRQQGTLIENAGALLGGFQEGAKDLSNTWLAVGTTISTMYERVLRGIFEPAYAKIIEMSKALTLGVMEHTELMTASIRTLGTIALATLPLMVVQFNAVAYAIGLANVAMHAFYMSFLTVNAQAALLTGGIVALKAASLLLFSAFAGWEIGKLLYDNFETARLAGLAFVDGIIKGWIHIKYAFETGVLAIKKAFWEGMLNIREAWIDFLELVGKGASHIPILEHISGPLLESVRLLRLGISNGVDYREESAKIAIAKTAELKTHNSIIEALRLEAINYNKLGESALPPELVVNAWKSYEDAIKGAVKETTEELIKFKIQELEDYKKWEGAKVEIIKAAEKEIRELRNKASEEQLKNIDKEAKAAKKAAEEAVDEEFKRFKEMLEEKRKLDEYFMESRIENIWIVEDARAEAWQSEIELMNRIIAKEKREYEKLKEDEIRIAEKALEDQQKEWERVYDDMHKFAADTFYDIFDGQLDSFEDFTDSMFDIFKRMLANMAAEAAMTNIFKPLMNQMAGSAMGNLFGLPASGGGGGTGFNLPIGSIYKYGSSLFGGGAAASSAAAGNSAYAAGIGNAGTIGGGGWSGGSAGVGVGAAGAISAGVVAAAAYIAYDVISNWGNRTPRFGFTGTARELWEYEDGQGRDETPYTYAKNDGAGIKSSKYDYEVFARHFDGQESEITDVMLNYFDTVFSEIDAVTNSSINDILKDYEFSGIKGYVKGGTFEEQFKALSSGVFDEMIGSLLADILPDAGTVEEKYRSLVGSAASSTNKTNTAGMLGRDAYEIGAASVGENYMEPIYEEMTRNISALAHTFNDEFFDALIPEGGSEWEAFLRFAAVVENSSDFLGEFTRQVDKFGESTLDAFRNIETIDAIILELDATMSAMAQPALISVLKDMATQWNLLEAAMKDAHAVIEDVIYVERRRNRAIGSQISGLSGASFSGMITSGVSVTDALNDALWGAFSAGATDSMMKRYINPLNRMIGEAFDESGDITKTLEKIPGILEYLEFDSLTLALEDAQKQFNEMLGIVPEIEELAKAEKDLADARKSAIENIEDLIRELEGGSLSPVQSMEWFEKQYQASLTGLASATTPEDLADAISRLTSSAPDYLDFAQDYGGNYKDTHGSVLDTLKNIRIRSEGGRAAGEEITVNVNVFVDKEKIENMTVDVIRNSREAQLAIQRVTA